MTAPELADVWVPVPLRWRHVQAGDVIVGTDGAPWVVTELASPAGECTTVAVHLVRTRRQDWTGGVDPDEVARVLVPVAERDAMTMCRDDLGARITERRAAG